ncbi:MAG TPA: cobalamin-binding protein [Firmicutes bacterium]|jgi:dimethylamine corrinoid protein|nr:cobalamin-binding protein [Bacillota bacterium]
MENLKAVTQAMGNLDEAKLMNIINDFVSKNPAKGEVLEVIKACQDGMAIVGKLYEEDEYFVSDLVFSGELMTEAINILKPFIGDTSMVKVGSIVLGTVHGDMHDIGKNIFKSMVEAAGFKVYDLGIDQPASAFVEKVKEVKPDIVGLSGVLTLALESMKDTVAEIKEAGLRGNVKIIIGGNPVTKEACERIGADAFTTSAAEGVRICQKWIKV